MKIILILLSCGLAFSKQLMAEYIFREIIDAKTGNHYYITMTSDVVMGEVIDTKDGSRYYVATSTASIPIRVKWADTVLDMSSIVQKSGDTMTGQLTIAGSSLTITGNAFSVGRSTFVVNNGFVGIGVNNPSTPFHVVGGAQGAQTAFITTSNLSQRLLELSSPFGSVANLFTATIGGIGPRFVINNNADVAIGKTTPTAKLDVEGNVKFSGNLDIGGYLKLRKLTKAELDVMTPSDIGQLYYCIDNPGYELAVSTGIEPGAFRFK